MFCSPRVHMEKPSACCISFNVRRGSSSVGSGLSIKGSKAANVKTRVRPTGVTILAVLEFLIGFFSLLGGLVAVAGAAFVGLVGVAALAVVALALGVFLVIIGIFSLLIGYGLWTGKSWAWTVGVIFSILGIIGGIISLATGNTGSIVGLILQV